MSAEYQTSSVEFSAAETERAELRREVRGRRPNHCSSSVTKLLMPRVEVYLRREVYLPREEVYSPREVYLLKVFRLLP